MRVDGAVDRFGWRTQETSPEGLSLDTGSAMERTAKRARGKTMEAARSIEQAEDVLRVAKGDRDMGGAVILMGGWLE